MQDMDPTYEYGEAADADVAPSLSSHALRRLLNLAVVALILLLLVLLPPLVSVNRYQKRIANSISASLGRPVHLDKVSLNLLPLPGFTLENFVVDEDPAFGSEPVIRANSVRATLRISSLWRRRIEFSTISFTDPSVNLVHTAEGKWNLESILLHASHVEAAPTAQKKPAPLPASPTSKPPAPASISSSTTKRPPSPSPTPTSPSGSPTPSSGTSAFRDTLHAPTRLSATLAPFSSKALSAAHLHPARSPSTSMVNGATHPSARPASSFSAVMPVSAAT